MVRFYSGRHRTQLSTHFVWMLEKIRYCRGTIKILLIYFPNIHCLDPIAEKFCIILILLGHLICDEVGLVFYLHIKLIYF